MDGFGMAAFCFELDGLVFDLEFVGHRLRLSGGGRS